MTNEIQKIKKGEGGSINGRNAPTQFSRLTKLEFPRFLGDDVKGWIFRCNQFFKLDLVREEHKVNLASVHLYDRVLSWHFQFIKNRGQDVTYPENEMEIMRRFGAVYEDPLAELKNLKQDGTMRQYQDDFDVLLSKVDLTEQQAISFYIGALQPGDGGENVQS